MRTPLLVFILSLFALSTTTFAAPGDFRVGTYEGSWGGFACRYTITTKLQDKLFFRGKIHLYATGETNDIQIKQLSDKGLSMTRHLLGAGFGQTQWVMTNPPQVQSGRTFFRARARGGPGMQGTSMAGSQLIMAR